LKDLSFVFMGFFHSISDKVKDFYQDPVFSQPRTVDLVRDFNRYSFLKHRPEETDNIQKLFDLTVTRSTGEVCSVRQLLMEREFHPTDIALLEKIGFHQRNSNPRNGIQLEHGNFRGWLIKKNFGLSNSFRLMKRVYASDFPFWFFPTRLRDRSEIGIQAPNEVIHPLRVVMLERGKQWIDRLHLHNLKAGEEYLYPLSDEGKIPLHLRVVVISKKEDILGDDENIRRFIKLAEEEPEKLVKIARQIVLFIKCTHLTDMHLFNFQFRNDDSNTLCLLDGEPIGALADESEPPMVKTYGEFDPAFFPILGLKYLKANIPEQLQGEGILQSTILKIQGIFDKEIDQMITEITIERTLDLFKKDIMQHYPILDPIFMIFALIFALWSETRLRVAPSALPLHQ
jgi:hypothetical protein